MSFSYLLFYILRAKSKLVITSWMKKKTAARKESNNSVDGVGPLHVLGPENSSKLNRLSS